MGRSGRPHSGIHRQFKPEFLQTAIGCVLHLASIRTRHQHGVETCRNGLLCEWQAKRPAIGIQEAIYRTHGNATRLVKVAYAFIAFVRVDFINIIAFGDRPGWAFRLAKTAIDTIIGDR